MAPESGATLRLHVNQTSHNNDVAARVVFMLAGLSVFLVLGFILWTLLSNTLLFFQEVSVIEFLTDTVWSNTAKAAGEQHWGILPLLTSTMVIALGAAVVGVPIGLGTAIYLAEYAGIRTRAIMKPVLEVLAGIPSIVFGFFALLVVSPLIHAWTAPGTLGHLVFGEQAGTFSGLNAIVVVGIMVIPIITSLSEDAIRAVPGHLREASLGLGATKWETISKVVIPSALSGITASIVLGVARAVGETMAVTLAAGAGTSMDWTGNPVQPMVTMTSFIVNRMGGDAPREGPEFHALFAVGFTLFAVTFALNILARAIVRRFREEDTT